MRIEPLRSQVLSTGEAGKEWYSCDLDRSLTNLLLATVFLTTILAPSAFAKPPADRDLRIEQPDLFPSQSGAVAGGLSSTLFTDTVSYGGTWWAPDSMRWEALRDSCWNFQTGIGSFINNGANPNKPVGYHQMMEGWFGIDQTLSALPYFRVSTTCVINGSYSAWAGITQSEANELCYAAGQGYGNSWNMYFCKCFTYPGAGAVTFSYKYAVACESGFDYAYAIIDTTGNPDPSAGTGITLASYTGVMSGTDSFVLTPGLNLPSSPGRTFCIWFNATSDGSYSDQDGLNPTACGHSAFDDITLSGAVNDVTTFEGGNANGWSQYLPTTGIGDFSNLVARQNLPPPATFCPCNVQDSVLVFYDLLGGHPFDQDNTAASPWIDLKRNGDLGHPGKLMLYSVYAELPINNLVFVQLRARFYPEVCAATGKLIRTGWRDQNIVFYYGEAPFCTPVGGTQFRDYSNVIPVGAEQVQIAVGVINLCWTAPDLNCTGVTNTTPWIDYAALGVFGSPVAPTVSLLTFDRLQDSFATDGTLNPSAAGRFDTNTIKDGSNPQPNTHLRDTLVARGNGGNTEVRMVFSVRPGPFTSAVNLAFRSTRWTPEPSIAPRPGAFGNTWYSARMDTAEQGGVPSIGNWMSTFHEAAPGFQGNDRTPDPMDPNQLENEILPDRILTPGSRVDYFIASRYLPPDPRNVGGVNWFLEQDTTGGRFREAEILPTSTAPDTTWNCVLYVDHHGDRAFDEAAIEEAGLNAALGPGGGNAEGTRYDRWDVETPSSGQLSLGRALNTNYGCAILQIFGYKAVAWHASTLASVQLTDEDANLIRPWLTLPEISGNRFWGSGDGLVRSMATSNEVATVSFMQNILGVLATCNTVREVACPPGTLLDSTFCLPLIAFPGAHFATTVPVSVRGNGCPNLRSFDVNQVNSAVATALGQVAYTKNGAPVSYASVTNYNTLDVDYRTVVDGFAVGSLRTLTGNPHSPSQCMDETAALARTADVLNWFSVATTCEIPIAGATPGDTLGGAPKYRTALGSAVPNPMSSTTTIRFENRIDGDRVRIDVVDITGRLVRTLLDQEMPRGHQDLIWDGRTDRGRTAATGMYFYRMSVGAYREARKILVLR